MTTDTYIKRQKKLTGILGFLPFIFPLLFFSCTQLGIYEKNTLIPDQKWGARFAATGSFMIPDTVSHYNIFLVLRHTDAYRYNNMWLNVGLQLPGDTMHYQKVDLQLGSDATGWYGAGMSDIWEVRKMLNSTPQPFKKKGIYSFDIAQIMREDPLLHVTSVGLRIEKAGPSNVK